MAYRYQCESHGRGGEVIADNRGRSSRVERPSFLGVLCELFTEAFLEAILAAAAVGSRQRGAARCGPTWYHGTPSSRDSADQSAVFVILSLTANLNLQLSNICVIKS